MIPENIIKLAIEGGWDPCDLITDWSKVVIDPNKIAREEGVWLTNPEGDGCFQTHFSSVLDPLFWQSLGKSLEWKPLQWYGVYEGFRPTSRSHRWHYEASRFFDLLLTGGDTEKFWSDLSKEE